MFGSSGERLGRMNVSQEGKTSDIASLQKARSLKPTQREKCAKSMMVAPHGRRELPQHRVSPKNRTLYNRRRSKPLSQESLAP
jgi:hypothetical protein